MSHLELIECLCNVVEYQNDVIRKLSAQLAALDAMSPESDALITTAGKMYGEILGADDAPDNLR